MKTCARLVWVFTLLATPAAAQSATEDGIRAMVAGDYQTAVRILRPLADDTSHPDPVAAFFLATPYDSGQGVRYDQNRACGLFRRASEQANPFVEQSFAIATSIRNQFGSPAPPFFCVATESWQGGPPLSIVLGPGHRIVFTDTSITLTYADKENRSLAMMGGRGGSPSIQYTPLAVTRPVVARRHFLQLIGWMPDTELNPSSWTLAWSLMEVVEDKWFPITSEKSLVVVHGPARPASNDAASLVRLRVNEKGEAELTIAGGSSPRTEVIPWKGSR
jgi:hypothetical protein